MTRDSQTHLLVRADPAGIPSLWSELGELLNGETGIWLFSCTKERLGELLTQLLQVLSPSARRGAHAFITAHPSESMPMSEMLQRLTSLEALHTRIYHPWIELPLEKYVSTHIQPIIDLSQNQRIFAYEALCRVRDDAGLLIGGGEALAIARRAGRLVEFDFACQSSALRVKQGVLPKSMPIFINAMPTSLLRSNFSVHPSFDLMQQLHVPPHEVVIEVVECEQVDDHEALAQACERLKAMGFRIALDDIGSGYSGLSLLAALRPDFVKIDRSLVHGAHNSRMRIGVLEALISMAQRLGCSTIAEGLEDVEDVELCRDLGVGYAQGFYFAAAAPHLAEPKSIPSFSPSRNRQVRSLIRLGDFLSPGETLSSHVQVEEAHQIFLRNPALEFVIVLDQGHPVGFLTRTILTRPVWAGIGRYVQYLNQILTVRVNVHSLLRRLYDVGGRVQPWVVVDDSGRYMGMLTLMGVLDHLLNAGLPASVHPLSELPTGPVLRSLIDQRIESGEMLQLVYLDLDHFKAFNDRYGFIRGDAMIKVLAEILRKGFDGLPDAELGHIGGDDFLLVTPQQSEGLEERLGWVIDRFHELAPHLYDENELETGFFSTQNGRCYPVATLSVVVVNGKISPLTDSVTASARAAQLKCAAKDRQGSVIVIEGVPVNLIERPRVPSQAPWRESLENALSSFPDRGSAAAIDDWFAAHPAFELVFRLNEHGIQQGVNWLNPAMRGLIKRGGEGMNRADRTYFCELEFGQKSYLSSIYVSRATEDFCISLALPYWQQDGSLMDVMVGDVNLTSLVSLAEKPVVN